LLVQTPPLYKRAGHWKRDIGKRDMLQTSSYASEHRINNGKANEI
jgi:hypothetical protein